MSRNKAMPILLLGLVVLTSVPVMGGFNSAAGQSAPAQAEAPQYQGDPVSLKLVNVSLVDFFRAISELSGLNILIDPDVEGTLTINVEKVPWDQLFDAVLNSHGLKKDISGNLVRIATKQTLKTEEEAEQALKNAAFQARDTVTITRHLDYAKGADLVTTLEKQLSNRGQINVDARTNTLILTDVAPRVEKINGLIEQLDVPEKQVEIEARIIEATTSFARELGLEFGFMFGGPNDRNQGGLAILNPAEDAIGIAGFKSGNPLDVVRLDALLSAGELTGEARILSKPRVSAQNNAEAKITQGSKIPIPVQMNFTTTVRYETAALQLTVTPQITEEDTVALAIKVENNVPDFSRTVMGIPTILTSESETRVLLADGGTTVIGGIYVEIDRSTEDRVPGLGAIPVFGNLFKKTAKAQETREILFFITPNIKK